MRRASRLRIGIGIGIGIGLVIDFATPEARAESPSRARIWTGVTGSFPATILPSTTDACRLGADGRPAAAGVYCTAGDGLDVPARTAGASALQPGDAGRSDGGFASGGVRILASVDVALGDNVLLGARVGGVASATSSTAARGDGAAFFAPLHLELRATYLAGDAPLARSGFAPALTLEAGASDFGASRVGTVRVTGVPGARPVDVWRTAGPAFAGVGAGVRHGLSPRVAFSLLVHARAAFGASGVMVTVDPEVALAYGF